MRIVWYVVMGMIGLSTGLVISAGYIAFLSMIGIVERLCNLSKTASYIRVYEDALSAGLILVNVLALYPISLSWMPKELGYVVMGSASLFNGIFTGCLAGALSEILDIVPMVARRLNIRKAFPLFLRAVAIGKCLGALLQFFILN